MQRRDFIKSTAASTTLLACFPADLSGVQREKPARGLERRNLGRTGARLSIVGFGGIVVKDAKPEEARARVAEAVDRGVNYFDVAPTYGDAEEKLGPALEPYRSRVFLACKTTQRKRTDAEAELHRSLQRLRTDYLDLYQLHAVTTSDEVETIFGPGGAMSLLVDARKAGKIRFLGFSAHSVEAALALLDRFPFDSILFPVNFRTWNAGNFGPQVLARAQEKDVGILALKAMANRPWPKDAPRTHPKCWYEPLAKPDEATMGLRFTLSHPVTAAIPPGDETLFRLALDLAAAFEPLTAAELDRIKQRALTDPPIFQFPRA